MIECTVTVWTHSCPSLCHSFMKYIEWFTIRVYIKYNSNCGKYISTNMLYNQILALTVSWLNTIQNHSDIPRWPYILDKWMVSFMSLYFSQTRAISSELFLMIIQWVKFKQNNNPCSPEFLGFLKVILGLLNGFCSEHSTLQTTFWLLSYISWRI